MPISSLPRLAAAALAVLATLGLAACGATARPGTGPVGASAGGATPPPSAAPPATEVARPAGPVQVFASPSGPPTMTLPATTSFGSARALVVTGRAEGWLQVQLPSRPNGATGWIRDDDVQLRAVTTQVRVDLSERSIEVLDGGATVLRSTVAVGTDATPTPEGRFFVTDKVATGSTSSTYGPFALGLSGYSEVLTEFGGGDGQIAIHGTDDPSSIGTAASHGCLRVPNDVVTRLADLLPLGTPVLVVG